MIIVPAYAGVFGLLFIILSARTIMARRSEYVPLTLLLISFAEQRGTHHLVINLLCAVFLIGRALHAWGVSQEPENFTYRVTGMMLTFGTLAVSALSIGYSYIF
jgi:uncharacterized protein